MNTFDSPVVLKESEFMVGLQCEPNVQFVLLVEQRAQLVFFTVLLLEEDLLILNYVKWLVWVLGN
jgi:hypothetical protein